MEGYSKIDIAKACEGLAMDNSGIWRLPHTASVAYPEDAHDICFRLEDASFWFRHRNNLIASVMKQFSPPGTLLDIGGGNGYVTRRLLDEGWDTVLLEPGPIGAMNAKIHRAIPTVLCTTLEESGFGPASVPAAGLFDVLEHIEDDKAFVKRVAKILQPGGLLYVTVPAYSWLWSSSDTTGLHFRRYSADTLNGLLSENFDLVYQTYFFRMLIPPIFLLRALPYRLGLSQLFQFFSEKESPGTTRGLAAGLMAAFLQNEMRHIDQGKTLRLGASFLVIAKRKPC
jgi:hypothetical protein